MATENPLPESVTGSAPSAEGSLPLITPEELTPTQTVIADELRKRVLAGFIGMDPFTPRSGYNHNVDVHGADTVATRMQDGFLAASLERGADLNGDPDDISYRMHRPLFADPEGYQRGVLALDDYKSGTRLTYTKSREDKDLGTVSKQTKDPAEIEEAAREFGISV